VAAACAAAEISLEELGPATGRVSSEIENELGQYDVVFATARMALEAAAVGCFVIVADGRGCAGALTRGTFAAWRPHNFGAKILSRPATPEALGEALSAYSPEEAEAVRSLARESADLSRWTEDIVAVYASAIAEGVTSDPNISSATTAALLEEWLPSPAHRAWKIMVTEKQLVTASPGPDLEAQNRIFANAEAQRHILKQIREGIAGLREALSGLEDRSTPGTPTDTQNLILNSVEAQRHLIKDLRVSINNLVATSENPSGPADKEA
jgi:hypothetical protein